MVTLPRISTFRKAHASEILQALLIMLPGFNTPQCQKTLAYAHFILFTPSFDLDNGVSFFFFFFGWAPGLRNPSSPTRDRTCAPHSGSAESQPLDRQGIPRNGVSKCRCFSTRPP